MAPGTLGADPLPASLRAAWPGAPRVLRRLLVLGADPGAHRSWASRVDVARPGPIGHADETFDALVMPGARLLREPAGPLLAEAQRVVRPGGALIVEPPASATRGDRRRLRSTLQAYFDVDEADGRLVARRRSPHDPTHFEQLAPEYWSELPPAVAAHYVEKKLAFIRAALPPEAEGLLGLDLGCGVGRYARDAASRFGVRVLGVDPARGNLREASREGAAPWPRFVAADAIHLPFRDAAFDFAYAINVLHHLKRGEQERALGEVRRVLKPGAPLVLLEMNTRNPLFGWYLRHVYPKTRRIDRGDEEFVHPDRLPLVDSLELERVEYATFTPDFAPAWLLRPLRALERRAERSRLAPYAIHYAAVLRRPAADATTG